MRTMPIVAARGSILEVCSDSLNTRSEEKKNSGRSESQPSCSPSFYKCVNVMSDNETDTIPAT